MKNGRRSLRAASRRLESWYRRHARDLPWRRRPTPYSVLVSETMLQQTTVDVVVPYFERFMERFPDLASLASAREEEVLALWSGLGYYRRARGLRSAARVLRDRHAGEVPRTREELLALPGIGPYTASAILAIAHGLPEVALDGNLRRVLSRLDAVRGDLTRARAGRLEALGRELVEGGDPSVINQALMDLGAAICTPRQPRCALCPLKLSCLARAKGLVDRIPAPRERSGSIAVRMAAAVARRGDRILMARRSGRLMSGLWELPMTEVGRGKGAGTAAGPGAARRAREAIRKRLREAGAGPRALAAAGSVRHTITRYRIVVDVFEAAAGGAGAEPVEEAPRVARTRGRAGADLAGTGGGESRWFPLKSLPGIPLGGLSRKILRQLGITPPGSGRS